MARTKGASDIPPRKKARILAKKNTQQYTRSELAKEFNVSEITIAKLNQNSVTPEVRKMAEKYQRDFITYAQAIAMKAQQRTFDTINELNAKDAAIVAEKNFKMVQIIQNRPTQIINEPTDEEIAKELLWRLVNNRQWSKKEALEEIKQAYPDVDTTKLLTD
jgi:predicted transcriptional regulator